ncbi:predicted protein [Arabidopsis lyrata subsp. lyrata]|uniref:Predicted protein n=1 Tax=Arabidopsis lyrata subsp. lyrata TaxID=81972 RepID=D7LPH6_ARALL|nr:predicted protein [Arabidopsis lyrata subsp. lyrata]
MRTQNQRSSGGEKLLPDNDGKSSIGDVAMRSGRQRSMVRNKRGKQLDLGTEDYGGLTGSLLMGVGRLGSGETKPPSTVSFSTPYCFSFS